MKKIDLSDVSFLMPVRIDSIDRLENIMLVVDFLLSHFDTNIQILEASEINNGILKKTLPTGVQIEYVEDFDKVFHRTYYINCLIHNTSSRFCAVWDADVIADCTQLQESLQILRDGTADFVYPYTELFLNVPEIIKEHFFETRDVNILLNNVGKMEQMYPPAPIGGAFIANREKYIESGSENENFYGWGVEDGERYNRWKALEYKVSRVEGPLFHFTHSRSINSLFHDNKQREIKFGELYHTGLMSKEELKQEIKKWRGSQS